MSKARSKVYSCCDGSAPGRYYLVGIEFNCVERMDMPITSRDIYFKCLQYFAGRGAAEVISNDAYPVASGWRLTVEVRRRDVSLVLVP